MHRPAAGRVAAQLGDTKLTPKLTEELQKSLTPLNEEAGKLLADALQARDAKNYAVSVPKLAALKTDFPSLEAGKKAIAELEALRKLPEAKAALEEAAKKEAARPQPGAAADANDLASDFFTEEELDALDRMASAMGLPRNVRETAAMIYRKAVNKNLIRGRSIEGVVAASLYAACRQCNVPRTLDEVASSSRVGRKEIGRTYRFMTRELSLKLMPTKPQDYVQRFCSELKLSGDVQAKAADILKDANKKELTSGRGPTGVAAAAIYIASILCNERRTQREVADIAGVTEVTIRNRYKELTDKLGIEIQL